MHIRTIIFSTVLCMQSRMMKPDLEGEDKEEKEGEDEKTQLHACPGDSEKAEVDAGGSDRLLWFSPVCCE